MFEILLGLALLLQPDATTCVNAAGTVEITVPKGTPVLLCFQTPIDSKIRYFRIRRAQTQEGSYYFWRRIELADCVTDNGTLHCGFSFTTVRTEHYFITTIYDDNGTLRETPGSHHARITVTP